MILAGQKERVAAYVASRIRDMGTPPEKDYEAIGVIGDADRLIGGVVYTHFYEIAPGQHDIRMHCAGEPGWLSKSTLRVLFGYPFLQLKAIRVTGCVAKANRKARALNERLGFKQEGCIRSGFGQGKDMIVFGMLRSECRWIRG